MKNKCRCGFSGDGIHPCHGNRYECKNPAKLRLYNPFIKPCDSQKFIVYDTYSCDECWETFKIYVTEIKQTGENNKDDSIIIIQDGCVKT